MKNLKCPFERLDTATTQYHTTLETTITGDVRWQYQLELADVLLAVARKSYARAIPGSFVR